MEANASRINQIAPGSDPRRAPAPNGRFIPLNGSQPLSGFNIKTIVVTKPSENDPPNVVAGKVAQPSCNNGLMGLDRPHFSIHHATSPSKARTIDDNQSEPLDWDDESVGHSHGKEKSSKNIRNGRWSPQEDNQLRDAVTILGSANFEALALMVPTRSAQQIKDRWTQFLAGGLNNSDLTPEEIKRMKKLLPNYVKNRKKPWSLLAKEFPGRSSSILKNAWKRYENSQKPRRAGSKTDLKIERSSSSRHIVTTPKAAVSEASEEKSSTQLSLTLPVASVDAYLQSSTESSMSSHQLAEDSSVIQATIDQSSEFMATSSSSPEDRNEMVVTTAVHQLTSMATPGKPSRPRPKPFLFSPNANSAPAPFTPLAKMHTYRASPLAQRQPFGQLDNSMLLSPPPNVHINRTHQLLSPSIWRHMEAPTFDQNILDASTHRNGDPFAFPSDLQSSVMLPDVNNASTDIAVHNWNFSDAWRV